MPAAVAMLPVAAKEAKRRSVWLAAVFAAIALIVLAIGLSTPKTFTSSTTLLVEEANIIEPLLKGRTTPTNMVDRAAVAREVAFSNGVMNEILKAGGWLKDNPDPKERAQLIEQITSSTEISNPRENLKLVKISYSDTDPQRAQLITDKFADLIIQESHRAKARESQSAFRFLDSQVADYHKRLTAAENKLAAYRKEHPEVMLGDQEDVTQRISQLQLEMDRATMDLADQSSRAGVWNSHLAQESRMAVTQARPNQLRGRLMELQAERDKLAGTVTDRHPDMVRVQNQINDLQRQMRSGAGSAPVGSSAAIASSPELSGVRNQAAEARSMSTASASRVAAGRNLIAQELARLQKVAALGGELADLTRNYELNRTLYQDLLERRENARLAMNLDEQRGGLNFRVQEPANLPMKAGGMSLTQFASGGLLLAVLIPALLLFGWVRFDPRVRSASQIEQLSGLPVLGSIPAGAAAAGPRHGGGARSRQKSKLAFALVLVVPIAYALAMILR
ncbi:XrtA system polysaccharide chain length determinant [Lysobacter korlensis]|uniref:XrtA system polysaccharide chain length determinant n=1 Tax=Lysobacter korlensis TaxID=553636 RepID=A0ABV6RQ92_9GAMM